MLDRDGYRPNVAIILVNAKNEVFWGKRIREHSWQFPQGGINPVKRRSRRCTASWRRKSGSRRDHVKIIGRTRDWLRYEVPDHWIKRELRGNYRGQKQIWFLLRMVRARQRRQPARRPTSGIRRLALARLLGAAGRGDRVQARRVPARAHRAVALPAPQARADALPAPAHPRAAASSRRRLRRGVRRRLRRRRGDGRGAAAGPQSRDRIDRFVARGRARSAGRVRHVPRFAALALVSALAACADVRPPNTFPSRHSTTRRCPGRNCRPSCRPRRATRTWCRSRSAGARSIASPSMRRRLRSAATACSATRSWRPVRRVRATSATKASAARPASGRRTRPGRSDGTWVRARNAGHGSRCRTSTSTASTRR